LVDAGAGFVGEIGEWGVMSSMSKGTGALDLGATGGALEY